jgi:hypothetical protein
MNEQVHPALREPLNAHIEAAANASPDRVTALVELAISKNVPVKILERLVALKERVEERDARKAFFDAVARFQEECPVINKSQTAEIITKSGARFSYTYAPLEEIARTIRPHLKACGLSYSWNVHSDDGKVLNVACVLRHVDGHEERAGFPVPIDADARMSGAQKNGAALTYGKRQSLLSVLGLTTADTDVDGMEGSGDVVYVTPEQAANLSDLLELHQRDKRRFCTWMRVESLAAIPADRYQFAVDAITGKHPARDMGQQ